MFYLSPVTMKGTFVKWKKLWQQKEQTKYFITICYYYVAGKVVTTSGLFTDFFPLTFTNMALRKNVQIKVRTEVEMVKGD